MKATLHTPNYRVPDLELVTGFEVRRGEEFTIVLTGVPEGSAWLTDEDDILQVKTVAPITSPEPLQAIIGVKALKDGASWLHVRKDDQETLVKKWKITVFSDEAAGGSISAGAPEPK